MGAETDVTQGLVELSGSLLGPGCHDLEQTEAAPTDPCVFCAHSGGEAGAAWSHAQLHGGWRWR